MIPQLHAALTTVQTLVPHDIIGRVLHLFNSLCVRHNNKIVSANSMSLEINLFD